MEKLLCVVLNIANFGISRSFYQQLKLILLLGELFLAMHVLMGGFGVPFMANHEPGRHAGLVGLIEEFL